jgi:AAA15 family ATPase/GTPase
MISELKIRNFKSLESVDLKLGHFNLLVGANASGKSNFLDALRFLQGVGNGFSIDEILNGKPPSNTSVKWEGIRGGSEFSAFRKPDGARAETTKLDVTFSSPEILKIFGNDLIYSLTFSTQAEDSILKEESFTSGRETVIPEHYKSSSRIKVPIFALAGTGAFAQRNNLDIKAIEDIVGMDKEFKFWGFGHFAGCAH